MTEPKKLNVLHIGKYYAPFSGGIESVTQSICEGLVQHGHTVSALVHDHQPMQGLPFRSVTTERKNGVQVLRSPILGRLLFTPLAPLFGLSLCKALKREPDVLHLHMPNPSVFWCLFSRKARRIPWVVHWHSDVIGDKASRPLKLFYKIYRPFERAVLKRAAAVVTTSPHYAEHSVALAELPGEKLKTIPIGISEGAGAAPPQAQFRPQPQLLRVLTVGRLTYYKGHKYMLQALATLRSEVQVEWEVIGTGEERASLRSLAEQLGVSGCVNLSGRASDQQLARALDSCDVFLLPSIERTEAFGVVLLEAMRAGKPCIVTDVAGSGMNWVVQNGHTGWVVKAADSDSLAVALKDAATNKNLWHDYGLNGRQRFLDEFTSDRVNQQWIRMYQSLVLRPG